MITVRNSVPAGAGGTVTTQWPKTGPTKVIADPFYLMDGTEATMEFTNTTVPTVVVTCPALPLLTDGQIFVFKTLPGVTLLVNSAGIPIDGTAAVLVGDTASGDRATLMIEFLATAAAYIILGRYPYSRVYRGFFNTAITGMTYTVTGLVAKPLHVSITALNTETGSVLVGTGGFGFGYYITFGPGGQFVIQLNDAPATAGGFDISYLYMI